MEWDRSKTLQFIESYRQARLLWDECHEHYKLKHKRHDALVTLSVAFGVDKSHTEKRIKNLQTRFSKEYKKAKDSQRSGAGVEDIYVPKWYAYDALLFLRNKNRPRPTTSTEVCYHHSLIYLRVYVYVNIYLTITSTTIFLISLGSFRISECIRIQISMSNNYYIYHL